jgi:hypothetical protein
MDLRRRPVVGWDVLWSSKDYVRDYGTTTRAVSYGREVNRARVRPNR